MAFFSYTAASCLAESERLIELARKQSLRFRRRELLLVAREWRRRAEIERDRKRSREVQAAEKAEKDGSREAGAAAAGGVRLSGALMGV